MVLDALLWLDRTGAPWRDLPERFGPWRSVATRFYRWTRSGQWEHLLAELRRMADAAGGIDWEAHLVDGTSVRAHRCAAGGKGGGSARRWAAAAVGLCGPGMRWCGSILNADGSACQASQIAWKGVRQRSALRCLAKL